MKDFPVVSVLGPRQVGKTTLARQVLTLEEFLSLPAEHWFG